MKRKGNNTVELICPRCLTTYRMSERDAKGNPTCDYCDVYLEKQI